jgi:hypothetical protein
MVAWQFAGGAGNGLRRLRTFFEKKVLRTPKNFKNVICAEECG